MGTPHLPPRAASSARPRWAAAAAVPLLLATLAAACDPPRPDRQGTGGEPRPGDVPERIVSLVPSATAVLLALGAGESLVGRTDFDTARALAHLPSIGVGLQPDLERLLELRPDLVIRFAGPSDETTGERLDRLGVRHVAVRPDRVEDVRGVIRRLGDLTGRRHAADSLLSSLDAALAEVRAAVSGRPPVRTAYLLGGTPPWVAGPGTYIDELIGLAGGVNVFGDLDRLYAPVSPEELVARPVDVLLTARGAKVDRALVRGTPLRELGPGVELPGPALGDAAREVARALHPGILP